MEVVEQLSIFLSNKPGALARVTKALAEENVSLRAFSTSDTVDHAVVRFVPDDSPHARDVLERGGALVVETDVLLLRIPERPGALAEISASLASENINIEYSYGSAGSDGQPGILIVRVSDNERAKKILAAY